MLIDGYEVNVDDHVYDVVLGAGTVIGVHEDGERDRCTVQFGDHRQVTFTDDGFSHFKFRTLYWKNPIVVIPSKDDGLWEMQQTMARTISEQVNRHAKGFRP